MLEGLLSWLQELIGEPAVDEVPIEVRIINLAAAWDVTVEVARRMVCECAAVQGMGHVEAAREIVER